MGVSSTIAYFRVASILPITHLKCQVVEVKRIVIAQGQFYVSALTRVDSCKRVRWDYALRPKIHARVHIISKFQLGIYYVFRPSTYLPCRYLTLLGLGLIKINTVSANFYNPRPSLILNN